MQPWFERYPQRLQRELQALSDAGFPVTLDEEAKASGLIRLTVTVGLDNTEHQFTVVFPDLYPFFSFSVFAPSLPITQHKDPYSGILCFVANNLHEWRISDTVAAYLTERLPVLLKCNQDKDAAPDLEAHEAEQITGHIDCPAGPIILTENWNIPPGITRGYLLLGHEAIPAAHREPGTPIRAAVLEIQDEKRNVIARLDDVLRRRFHNPFRGRWVRLPAPPVNDGAGILNEAITVWPELKRPLFDGCDDVVGLLMPEQLHYDAQHEAWVFVARWRPKQQGPSRGAVVMHQRNVRADQISLQNLQLRVPRLTPLREKTALLVGLGALGSPAAMQLARAGLGKLHLLDGDHVQVGNLPRWLLGLPAVGHAKSHILAGYLQNHYPYLTATPFHHRLGQPGDLQVLGSTLDGVDIIIDMSAEWTVNHALSSIATELGLPYVWATATPGGWGGVIGRVVPRHTEGCWGCFQARLNDPEGGLQLPAQEEEEGVQGVGCFHPTFRGAGMDLDQVSLNAVRLAVSTLCAGAADAYPDFPWDIGILNLWDPDEKRPIAPTWQTSRLIPHPHCPVHGEL